MKTVVAYLAGVPPSQKVSHKTELLKKFISGVQLCNDRGIAHPHNSLLPCNLAVVQGWVHEGSARSPHLMFRKQIVDYQKKVKQHTLLVDSNLFNYKDKDHPIHYSRYSLDGVFPTTGNYMWDNPDPQRWQQISRDLGIYLKDWRTAGNHILICTQRNGGWSMKGLSVPDWLEQTVIELRKYTDRPIIVRGHPGDKKAKDYLKSKPGKYVVSTNPSILDDLKNAWATITYNSSPGVASSIEGIPTFITDPNPVISQAYDVGNYDLSKIENPELKERQQWVEKISMCHWHFGELEDGSAWRHFRKFV
jgi:hypothetical protein